MRLIDADQLRGFVRGLIPKEERRGFDEFIDNAPTEFDIDIVINQIEEYGKYKGVLIRTDDRCENYIPVSEVKKIIENKGFGEVFDLERSFKNEEK